MRALSSVQQFLDALGRTRDNGALAAHDNGPIHRFGMGNEQANERFAIAVVVYIQAQLTKGAWVQHLFGFDIEKLNDVPEFLFAEWIVYVFDNVELDVAVAQYG